MIFNFTSHGYQQGHRAAGLSKARALSSPSGVTAHFLAHIGDANDEYSHSFSLSWPIFNLMSALAWCEIPTLVLLCLCVKEGIIHVPMSSTFHDIVCESHLRKQR